MTQVHPIQHDVTMMVTTNIRNRRPLFKNAAYAWEAIDVLYRVQVWHAFFLFGFVIMPDHCHILLHVPAPNMVSKVVERYKSGVSHSLGIGPIWQPRFHIQIPEDTWAVLEYIHNNPVKAGLVEESTTYPWSSACGKWDVTNLGDLG